MVIFKHHAGNLDTVIYGNAVVYKDKVVDIDHLDSLKFDTTQQKFEILEAIKFNKLKDDVTDYAYSNDLRQAKAIAFATQHESSIRLLGVHDSQEMRATLAGNPSLPRDLVNRLSRDVSPLVRLQIAKRDDLTEEIIQHLSSDSKEDVRIEIAERDDLSDATIVILASDKLKYIREAVAEYEDLPNVVKVALVNDKEESVRELMAERWDLDEDLMRKLANDTDYIVRRNIALNE